jgi:hypothetical protein
LLEIPVTPGVESTLARRFSGLPYIMIEDHPQH